MGDRDAIERYAYVTQQRDRLQVELEIERRRSTDLRAENRALIDEVKEQAAEITELRRRLVESLGGKREAKR